jgi:hypothetical protein
MGSLELACLLNNADFGSLLQRHAVNMRCSCPHAPFFFRPCVALHNGYVHDSQLPPTRLSLQDRRLVGAITLD